MPDSWNPLPRIDAGTRPSCIGPSQSFIIKAPSSDSGIFSHDWRAFNEQYGWETDRIDATLRIGANPEGEVTLPKFGNNLREIPAKLHHTENKLLALISLAA
jgi:hypothetical protein